MKKAVGESDARLTESRERGFEVTDANVRNVLLFAGGLLLFIVLSLGVLAWLYGMEVGGSDPVDSKTVSSGNPTPETVDTGRKSIDEDRAELEEDARAHLEGYSWNEDGNTLQIPIERAMELIAEEAEQDE